MFAIITGIGIAASLSVAMASAVEIALYIAERGKARKKAESDREWAIIDHEFIVFGEESV